MKIRYIYLLAGLLLTACGGVKNSQQTGSLPVIYPDYVGVTIPSRIAPLDFCMDDESFSKIDVSVSGKSGKAMHVKGKSYADFPVKAWHKLIESNAGDSVYFTVSAKNKDGWKTYKTFGMYVSTDEFDYGLNYRLIAPGYEVYSLMGIYERNLSNFDEIPLIENSQFAGCVNCHSYNRCDPADLSLHIRGEHGATLIRKDGKMDVYNTSTDSTLASCVYPYWHPTGRFIAYSTNNTRQGFHVGADKIIEVFDHASDLQVYDVEKNRLITTPGLKQEDLWETFPAFSADGKTLYFCRAEARAIPSEVTEIRYSLYKVAFDANSGRIGTEIEPVIDAASMGKSISFPRPSFDGRYLMYTLSDYGNFSIWHHESDLWMLDLQTGETRILDAVNSEDTDSYHNWSSNSKWFVFSSRRENGLHTRPFFSHIDESGNVSKPFLLPQRDPRRFYENQYRSYNVPEFVTGPVNLDRVTAGRMIENPERTQMGFAYSE